MKEHSIIKLGGGHFTCSKCGKTVFGSTKHRCNMIPESKLKDKCTPEIIKRMCELAEGFEFIECENNYYSISVKGDQYGDIIFDDILFPLLIHRAVEGWNKKNGTTIYIKNNSVNYCDYPAVYDDTYYWYKDYQPSFLTPCECACLHCLIEVLG